LAGIGGGILLLFNPSMGMFWQGLALIATGCVSLAIWHFGLGSRKSPGSRKTAVGPTFSPDDPEVAALPPMTTTRLREQVNRDRERRKQAQD
jgi:hypothetical protein